jgi:polyhydroxyalkanoate synthesis regulator phasin
MMSDRFDFEQQIMQCWNIVDEIKILNEKVLDGDMSTDRIANYLLGLETIYQIKFDKLWELFESVVCQDLIKNEFQLKSLVQSQQMSIEKLEAKVAKLKNKE